MTSDGFFELVGRIAVAWLLWLLFLEGFGRVVNWLIDRDERKRQNRV